MLQMVWFVKILFQDLSLSALAHPFFTTCLQFQDLEIVGKLKYHIERQLENYDKLWAGTVCCITKNRGSGNRVSDFCVSGGPPVFVIWKS